MNSVVLKNMISYRTILREIQKLYLKNNIPWVVGFSGGKDSTTVLQMVFHALSDLPEAKLSKEIHVLSNDTLVENPIIAKYMDKQLKKISSAGKKKLFSHNPRLFNVVKVKPKLKETFWVNLIGKGYPSPNRWFRWCTQRLKINPTSEYILNTVNKYGRAIIVLGTRKSESVSRAAVMNKYNNGKILRKHTLPNAFVYAPIADLSDNDVWTYLRKSQNPWGSHNGKLFELYSKNFNEDENVFLVKPGTQKLRFGCWVCTVVERDKSMESLIENGEKWMKELLKFRKWLYDIREQDNTYYSKSNKPNVRYGPFLLRTRNKILNRLLNLQKQLGVKLIGNNEVDYIHKLLSEESKGKVTGRLQKLTFKLPQGKHIVMISDFNPLLTTRKRIGPIYMKQAKFIRAQVVSSKYSKSTRVMYYLK